MALIGTILSPGLEADAWVQDRVHQRPTPLSPLTFIVPGLHCGRLLRRGLATIGYANVRTAVLPQIAEGLGAAALAREGLSPLTSAMQDGAIRTAIGAEAKVFGATARHPATIRTLRQLFQRIRDLEIDDDALAGVGRSGEMARASVAVYRRYRELVEQAMAYDRTDLYVSATRELAAASQLLNEWGDLVLWFPTDLGSPARRFLRALAETKEIPMCLAPTSDADVQAHFASQWQEAAPPATGSGLPIPGMIVALDAAEEVTAVAREIVANLESGVPLYRTVIVYREVDPYASLLRDTLSRAGLPFSGLDGRPLSRSMPGKALLALLKMRERDFDRPSVVEFHGLLPHSADGDVPLADWERLSRDAGIVSGASQWVARLTRLADRARDDLAKLKETEDPSEGNMRRLERRSDLIDRIVARMADLAERFAPPAENSWDALCEWGGQVYDRFIVAQHDWDERETEARDLIAQEIQSLRAAGKTEPGTSLATFIESLTAALDSTTQSEGRLGIGVVVGPIRAIAGMSFDRVYILGITERGFPNPAPADPVLPLGEKDDLLGLRASHQALERLHFELALRAAPAGGTALTFPQWTAGARPVYPSPWLVELAAQAGYPVKSADLRMPARDKAPASIARSLDSSGVPLSLADYRLINAPSGAALLTSGLATRADLPLALNMRTRTARRSSDLTEYDGCLADAGKTSKKVASGLSGIRISPTAVQEWAECPFHYFLSRWLRVAPTELPEDDQDWSLSAMEKGSLIHTILERFFGTLQEKGMTQGYSYTDSDRQLLESIAAEEIKSLEEAGDTGLALAWENERAALMQDLRTFLQKDEEERGEGFVPQFLEQGFGFSDADSWPPIEVKLPSGEAVQLRGRIDRVDARKTGGTFDELKVLDYKSGSAAKAPSPEDPLAAGTRIQLAAYTRAVETWLKSQRLEPPEIEAAYWYISRKGNFGLLRQKLDPKLSAVFDEAISVVDDSMRKGCFPQVPGGETMRPGRTSWDNCVYCDYDTICPASRDQLAERKKGDQVAGLHARLIPKVEET